MQATKDLTSALRDMDPSGNRPPSATSVAMEEIEAEARYANRTQWNGPIIDTHSFGAITLFAASDYARCFAEVFGPGPTPVYGHLVLARSALEACVISAWLNEPVSDPAERIKRGLCERIYSATELKRLKIGGDDGAARVQYWKNVGDRVRLVTNRRPWQASGRRCQATFHPEGF